MAYLSIRFACLSHLSAMICSFQCIGFTGLLLNSFLILTIRTDAETPILWPRDVKSWLIGKDPDAGKDWGQEENGVTEDEMVGWNHWLNEHEFEQTLGDSEGQGSLACCSPWVTKSRTWLSNWTTTWFERKRSVYWEILGPMTPW